ncbi:MAG: OB-fold nucleic acid binding domain-containing protein, partial [Chloroflexota bacterium]
GFYSPEVLVGDARRHGVPIVRPAINHSRWRCTVEAGAVRLGFAYVAGLGPQAGQAIEAEREQHGPFRSLFDFVERTQLSREAIENLIAGGAFDSFGLARRELLWQLGLIYRPAGRQAAQRQAALPLPTEQDMVRLPALSAWQRTVADYAILRLSPDSHPMAFLRRRLGRGVTPVEQLADVADGAGVRVAGLVVSRQRPPTASGFLFVTLEDETGLANVIIRPLIYQRYRTIARTEPVIVVYGRLQRRDGVTNVVASLLRPLRLPRDLTTPEAHHFR